MARKLLFIIAFATTLLIYSCGRKSHPAKTAETHISGGTESHETTKSVVKPKPTAPIPNVIVVNDDAAHKSVDGRYYYDVMGHRYWRNNKDGKYYLFNKSMYNNPDFKAPGH
jgi:hypothetical protein